MKYYLEYDPDWESWFVVCVNSVTNRAETYYPYADINDAADKLKRLMGL